jgi:hypothetical protein
MVSRGGSRPSTTTRRLVRSAWPTDERGSFVGKQRRMRTTSRPPLPPAYYASLVVELEEIADRVEQRPELNHDAASRLRKIAKDIREDAGLPRGGAKDCAEDE